MRKSRYSQAPDIGTFLTALSTVSRSGANVFDVIRTLWGGGNRRGSKQKAARPQRSTTNKEVSSWLSKITRQAKAEDRREAKKIERELRRAASGHREPLPGAAPAGGPPGTTGGYGNWGGGGGGGAGGGGGEPPDDSPFSGMGGILGAIPLERVVSSNVSAIGYDPNTGTMRVQFHAWRPGQPKGSGGTGPMYDYYDVPRGKWKSFQAATSKGKWVWDNLRIRGTISGHKYEYRLVSGTLYMTRQGPRAYIPRLATGRGLERRNRVVFGTKVKSSLPGVAYREGKAKRFFKGR